MSTFASVVYHPEYIIEENEYLYKLVQETDWMYQWVVIDLRQKGTYKQADRMLKSPKVLGIKIHPSYHDYDILDYGDELFSFAEERRAVVLMHPQHILQTFPACISIMLKYINKQRTPAWVSVVLHLYYISVSQI